MVVLPDIDEVAPFASGIEELVLVEKPELEVFRHLLAQQQGGFGIGGVRLVTNLFIQGRDLPLRLLEVAVGLLGIKHGRHEVRPVVAPFEQPRVGSEERQTTPSFGHHQHPEHLALLGCDARNLLLHLLCRQYRQRMRLVAEGIGEPLGLGDVCMEWMDAHNSPAKIRNIPADDKNLTPDNIF